MKCDELKWKWAYFPYLDAPEKQHESAVNAGYVKVLLKAEVDAAIAELNAENRRLKRALWLARAWRAKERQRMLPNNKEFYTWQEVERRCSKKAEEYK